MNFKLHPFVHGVIHFALRTRHIAAVAAIQAVNRFSTLTNGGAHTIHGGIATAKHKHSLLVKINQGVIRDAQIVKMIGLTDEISQSRNDAPGLGTRHAGFYFRVTARSKKQRIVHCSYRSLASMSLPISQLS